MHGLAQQPRTLYMYICLYHVCVCTYIYIIICIYIYMYSVYIHIYIQIVYVYIYMYIYMYTYRYRYMYACVRIHTYMHKDMLRVQVMAHIKFHACMLDMHTCLPTFHRSCICSRCSRFGRLRAPSQAACDVHSLTGLLLLGVSNAKHL